MVTVAYSLRSAAEDHPASADYAKFVASIDSLEDNVESFSANRCYLGYTPALTGGGTIHDQNCSAYGFTIALGWQTAKLALSAVEPGTI
jgi:hypothetical protein